MTQKSTEPIYRVLSKGNAHCVVTFDSRGVQLVVTTVTQDRGLADRWCRDLRRAAQFWTDRKQQAGWKSPGLSRESS